MVGLCLEYANRAHLGREGFCRLIRHFVKGSSKEVLLAIIRRLTIMPGPEEPITKVVVHPIVLLSVVDHFYRMGKVGNQKRVVGVLLGSRRKGVLDVANSFAGKDQNFYRIIWPLGLFTCSSATLYWLSM